MTIRIRMLNGETVDTVRHTYGQAIAARAAGVGIEVGGVDEDITWIPGDDISRLPPVRTLYPEGIASIDRVSE